jgi:hypothetical protein
MMKTASLTAKVVQGFRVASGMSETDRRFPGGCIAMQLPHFKQRGLDLDAYFDGSYFSGTLNLSFAPQTYDILKPEYFMKNVNWTDAIPPENFYLDPATVTFKGREYKAMIYIPDPATKVDHFNPPTMLDIISKHIPGISYGDEAVLTYNPLAIRVKAS